MRIYCTNPAAKRQNISVPAVSDEPLQYGKGYRVVADIGEALLAQGDHWSEEEPGSEDDTLPDGDEE